jgi:outer membrane protein TolC
MDDFVRLLHTGKSFSPTAVCGEKYITLMNCADGVNSKRNNGLIRLLFFLTTILIIIPISTYPQNNVTSDSIKTFTLEQCIEYALQHQPSLNQSIINQSIARTSNAISLSGWLPQLSLTGNLIHFNQLPTSLVASPTGGGPLIPTREGMSNTFIPEITASETIFDPQLLSAALKAHLFVRQAEQATDSTKIFIVSTVSKSFYNLLMILDQINVLKEDTARLGRTVTDTREQFDEGIVDETDYQQAVITLNNSDAQLEQQTENVIPAYAALKQIMGYPQDKQFNVSFDTTKMDQEIAYDTSKQLQYEKRIEFQQLVTAQKLQHQQTVYDALAFLPSVSVFYTYYDEYESGTYSDLFKSRYPYSDIGLSFNLPIFTGFSRIENLHESSLQEDVLDLSGISLKSQIYSEYTSALGNYKSNIYNWRIQKDNQVRAKKVFDVVQLQYEQGIVAYLNLIVAESNLITAEIGYVDALYQLLSSKIDLEKAMGDVPINY